MERDIIQTHVENIPTSELGRVQEDDEIWEGYDGGAKFMVSRHILPTPNRDEMVSLSVSGETTERERVIAEFIDVLGEPFRYDHPPEPFDKIDVVAWVVSRPPDDVA